MTNIPGSLYPLATGGNHRRRAPEATVLSGLGANVIRGSGKRTEVGVTVPVRVSATVTGHRRRGVREHVVALDLPPGQVTARQLIEAAVTLILSVAAGGTPELAIARDGRTLKSVPALLRKDPDVTALQARKTADDDPKTAEIVSKALLLARDHEIQDPSILGQLRLLPELGCL